ncbi:phage tail tape measure protein [Bacteroides gallinaceum]|uniref:phage tail tape measure protein n=1 Tax=Bacteroides gallinaceum TaxID=1462571 RepID=UPI001958563D|nr:phage tail tape measure protein [Bacteroides gallinaceum]MBM6657538.1 phage tail tape measure protein [Bacteroides gallinaceum]
MAINQVATVEVRVNGEEAKQELKDLEKYATSLKGQLADAYKAGDTSKIKQVTSELRKTEAQIKTLKKDTTALTEVMNNLDKATPKELRATLTAINRQLNSGYIKRGSAEWKYYQQQAKLVTAELQKIKTEVQETESWISRFNNGLTKWGGLLATGAATLTGVSMALNTLRNNRDSKESSQAELKALTGLDDSSIQWLTEQAEKLSTTMDESGLRIRQSSDEILQAYMLIGSKKPELLKDKEALNAVTIEAMRLSAAAKIDLKDAVTATTVSLNMYGESADQAARYVNVLAAGSKEGAADVSAQAAAIKNAGVAASGAGVSIEQLQGTIQMLAEKGLEAEPAGTALRKFFLVLQTGPDETNPKVVGLQTALENLNKKSLSAAQIQTMFGEEAYSAATILIDNADKVRQYTEAVTDTNIAMEQAAINSDTNEAKMAQYRNSIKEAGIELMERLNPSLSLLTGWTTKIIVALPKLIDWFIKYKGIIITSTAAITAYTVTVNASTIATKLYETWTKLATVATRGFNTVLKANPFGLAVAGLTAIATALMTYVIPNTRKAKDEQKSYNEELEKMTKISDSFVDINKRADNLSKLNDRQKQNLKTDAQEELAIIEDKLTKEEIAYNEQFEKEKKRIQERDDINETTRKVLLKGLDGKFKAQRQAIEALAKQRTELQNIIDKIPDIVTPVVDSDPNPTEGGSNSSPATKENPQVTAENKRYYDELADLKKSYLASDEMTQQEYSQFMEDLEMRHLENMLAIAGLEPEKRQQIEQKILEARIKYKEECEKLDEEDAKKSSEEAFTRLEKQYQLEIEKATQKHYDGLSSEQEYRQQLMDIQNEYYDQVLSSSEISEEKKAEIIDKKQKESLEKSRKNYEENQRKVREQLSFAQNIGQQFGEAFAEMLTDSETSLGDFMKETLKIILDSLQKMMIAYIAETQMKNIATLGLVGIVKAAAEIALITAAFQSAKAIISGFETGGYTGTGRHDEPKGIVHAGEFVANRYAVQNPAVRPVLDLIDQAQRNNTIGSLTAKDVSAVLSGVTSTTNNTYYQQSVPADNGMSVIMLKAVKVIDSLNKRLDEPIYTYTRATGKMGVNEAQDLVARMKNNVSRRIKL